MKSKFKLKDLTVDKLYFILSFLLIAVAVLVIALSKGENFKYLFWHGSTLGYYPDLFESVIHARTRNPYSIDAIYPAFAYCLIYFFNWFIPGTYKDNFDDLDAICSNYETLVIAHIFYAAIVLTIAYMIIKSFGKEKYIGKYLLVLIFISSAPFIFLIERGNTVIITIVFLFIYILYYNSENKKLRELALICLACAAAMKLYPAVFGLLLIADKKWKEAFRAVIYGILLFVVPFVFMGGINQIPQMLANSLTLNSNTLSGSTGFGYGFKVNATNSIACVLNWLTGRSYVVYIKMAAYFVVGLLLFGSLFIKSNWKRVAALSLVVILMPDFSFIYNVIYLLVPLALFIIDVKGKKLSFMNVIYTLCFVGAFAPFPYGDIFRSIGGYNNMNWGTLICSMALIALALLIATEGIVCCVKTSKKFVIGVIVISLVFGMLPYGLSLRESEPDIQKMEDVWTLTEDEQKSLDLIYNDVIGDIENNNNIICFPRVDTLKQFEQYDNTYWFSMVENDDVIGSSRLFKNYDPQFVVMDLSNYSNYKLHLNDEDDDVVSTEEYSNLMTMQYELITFLNKKDYEVVANVATDNNRYIAVWEKSDYVDEENSFWGVEGTGEEDDPYMISSVEQLKKFAELTNCGEKFEKEYIQLANDINCENAGKMIPAARYDSVASFEGVFDGNGYTISNMDMKYIYDDENSEHATISFINNLEGMIINLAITDSVFQGVCCTVFSRVSKTNEAVIANCISKNNTVRGSIRAGAVADKYGAYVVNTLSINNKVKGKKYQGFVSLNRANPVTKNCYSTTIDEQSGASTITEDVINTQFIADSLNASSENFIKLQKKHNAKQRKKKKKKRNIVIIPNLNSFELVSGELVISHNKV